MATTTTLREQYTSALAANGWARDYGSHSYRYHVFWNCSVPGKRIYLGSHGSIRIGKNRETSVPLSAGAIEKLLGRTI